MLKSNISPVAKKNFDALISGEYSNFALFSCFADGKPVSAICAVTQNGDISIISPLFITVPDGMVLTDHDGNPA
jgi:hypothetical protein